MNDTNENTKLPWTNVATIMRTEPIVYARANTHTADTVMVRYSAVRITKLQLEGRRRPKFSFTTGTVLRDQAQVKAESEDGAKKYVVTGEMCHFNPVQHLPMNAVLEYTKLLEMAHRAISVLSGHGPENRFKPKLGDLQSMQDLALQELNAVIAAAG